MIQIAITPLPGAALLTIDGLGGFAEFTLTLDDARVLRDQFDRALQPRKLAPTLAALIEGIRK